jgi:hypothetical protein
MIVKKKTLVGRPQHLRSNVRVPQPWVVYLVILPTLSGSFLLLPPPLTKYVPLLHHSVFAVYS